MHFKAASLSGKGMVLWHWGAWATFQPIMAYWRQPTRSYA
jgi:hypothetical protein